MIHNPANPFEAALFAGKGSLRALKGKRVIYRTDTFEVEVTARVGTTTFVLDTGEQFNKRARSRDFIIEASELIDPISGELFEPCEGHCIAELVGRTTQVYECLPFGEEPAWRHCGTPANEFRMHTKRVGKEPMA